MNLRVKLQMPEHEGAPAEWFYSHPHRYLRGSQDGALAFTELPDALKECTEIFHHHIEQAESVPATVEVVDLTFINKGWDEVTLVRMEYLPDSK